jgi:hypothetical protein
VFLAAFSHFTSYRTVLTKETTISVNDRHARDALALMARTRDYALEYERRRERARLLGFASEWQRRRSPRKLRSAADFGRLPDKARESRSRALAVVHRARVRRSTVEEQADAAGMSIWEVRYWAGEALEPTQRGRTPPRAGDRLLRLRPLIVEGENELVFVTVRGSRASDRADPVFDVQWRFVNGDADEAELDEIRGMRIGGRTVEGDPDRLEYLGRLGTIDPLEAYRETIG